MKRIHVVGLCLMAAFTFSAIAATSAMASPEFVPGPKGFPTLFSGLITNEALKPTLTAGGTTVACTSSLSMGNLVAAMEARNIQVTFHGCKSSGINCTTSGQTTGLIVTKLLKGLLGWANKGVTIVGLALLAQSGNVLAEFECTAAIKVVVTGQVTGELTPFKVKTSKYQLLFAESAGKQALTEYELLTGVQMPTVLETSINGGAPVASRQMSEDTVTTAEEGEIK